MVFRFSVAISRSSILVKKSRYSFSWAKLRFARYMIWVFRSPSWAMVRISAIMSSLSRRLFEFSKAFHSSSSL